MSDEKELRTEYHRMTQVFAEAMEKKALKRWEERPMDHDERRRMDPWNHPRGFLLARFIEEIDEVGATGGPSDEEDQELLDVANFCFYLWAQRNASK